MKIKLIKLKFNDTHSYKYKPFAYCCDEIQNDKAIVFTGEDINDIGGEYMSVVKDEEHYTKHTKTVYEYDEDGNVIGSHEEEYWTWDLYDSDNKHCDKVTFLGIEFDYGQIYKPYENYIDTIDGDYHVRYVYYGSKTEYTGTIFTKLDKHTINKTEFYKDMNINETVDHLQSNAGMIGFWIFWVVLIGGMVYGFYYLDNRWLD